MPVIRGLFIFLLFKCLCPVESGESQAAYGSAMPHTQGISLGTVSCLYCICISAMKSVCDLIGLLEWNVSLLDCHYHLVCLHRGDSISSMPLGNFFKKRDYFLIVETGDIIKFHPCVHLIIGSFIRSFIHSLLWAFPVWKGACYR